MSPVPPTARRRPGRLAAATIAALLPALPVVSSCGLLGGGGVRILGDSITMLVTPELRKQAGPDLDLEATAAPGLRVDEQIDQALEIADGDPDQVIVNLGTNNVLQNYDTIATSEDIKSVIDAFDGVGCVHLVTVNEHMTNKGADFSAQAAALNIELRTLAQRQLNVDIIDWNQIVTDAGPTTVMDADTVHPNPDGVKLLAKAYLDAIDKC